MSSVLATMADALIDFILSLLHDPETAAEFEEAPEATLAARGMQDVSHDDLCAVLPLVYDHPQVIQRAEPTAVVHRGGEDDVIRELRNVISNNSYITNNSTLVDQSVNQNIWAEGDVMQLFDNEAVLATGEGSTAAGNDIVHDSSADSSTTITTGGDAVIDNEIDLTTVENSHNQTVEAPVDDAVAAPADAPVDPLPDPEPEPAPEPEPEPADEMVALSAPDEFEELAADDEY